jgi:thiol-disulfide isomerase/thioredoxin
LLGEIRKFISDHSGDGFGLYETLTFAAYQDWVPPEMMENLVKAIEANDPNGNPRAFMLHAKASREKNKEKRIALLKELADKYPSSQYAASARKELFSKVTDLGEREKLYQQIRSQDPDDPMLPWDMASAYLHANQKLPEALALLDEAEKLLDTNAQNKRAKIHYFESSRKEMKVDLAVMRADILLRQGKFREVVDQLGPLKGEFFSGHSYYLLGRALQETGNTQAALDAYLEAVVRPSGEDLKHNAALESLWFREKLGSEQDLQQKVEAKLAQRFRDANYVPRVFRRLAPDFDLVTLSGEKLNNSQLRGKKVVLNFWAVWCAPCRPELRPLQDFQAKHPEVVVASVVILPAEDKQLEAVVGERQLTTLRIAKATQDLWEKFGVVGVPNTLVIDEDGYVRVQHLEAIPDVACYLEADFKAIAEAGPSKQVVHAAK